MDTITSGYESILDQIETVLFSLVLSKRKSDNHKLVIDTLFETLKKDGWIVKREKGMIFTHYSFRDNYVCFKGGAVDLYAIKNYKKLVIEFDNGRTLKYKSIEKLFHPSGCLAIGIVRGKVNQSMLFINKDKINATINSLKISDKTMFFISIKNKETHWINC